MLVLWSAGSLADTGIPFSSLMFRSCSRHSRVVASASTTLRFWFTRIAATPGLAESACARMRRGDPLKVPPGADGWNRTVPTMAGSTGRAAAAARSLARRRALLVVTTWKPSVSGGLPPALPCFPVVSAAVGGPAERLRKVGSSALRCSNRGLLLGMLLLSLLTAVGMCGSR
ncbi:hypothetical protein MRX96_017444 [Rhipicephalus microplus]